MSSRPRTETDSMAGGERAPGRAPGAIDGLRPLGFVVPILASVTALFTLAGYLWKLPCKSAGFDFVTTLHKGCYTDIYPLYFDRGLAQGQAPYVGHELEYPVLTGYFMRAVGVLASWVNGSGNSVAEEVPRGMDFYALTCLGLALFAIVTVLATAYVAGRHSMKAGLMVGATPVLLLSAYINWDLLAVALSALALAAWAKRRPALAGALFGLAVASKFYPIVFFGPIVLLCVRAGKWRELARTLGGAAVAWLVVNLPIMIWSWHGWLYFYTFNDQRPIDWGSIFYPIEQDHIPLLGDAGILNELSLGMFLILCAGIVVLAFAAKRRPRLPQLLFLVLAAFLLSNKVWSPQYVLWLLPLLALARPKLPLYIVWQAGEIIYYFGIWQYLLYLQTNNTDGLAAGDYYVTMLCRFVPVLVLGIAVVIEVLRPERDVVRRDGADDPAGGILDGAPDVYALPRARLA